MDTNQDEPKSLLGDLRQHHKVRVLNPLSTPFSWPIARSAVSTDPRLVDKYLAKADIRNGDHPTVMHVQQTVTIPAGGELNLPGDVAQVYVKHLVDAVLNETNKLMKSNPTLRHETEKQVMPGIEDLRKQVTAQSIEDQFAQQIAEMNPEAGQAVEQAAQEQAFPDLNQEQITNEPEPAFPSVIPKPVGRKPSKQTA